MIVTCVYVHVKSDAIKDFIEASVENHKESVNEPGNLRFDFLQQSDDPCRFMIYEAYESEEAAAAHKNTRHYIKWRDTVAGYMDDPRFGKKYNIIEPRNKAKW
jgi:autoinducer 2-degrading protein